MAALRPTRARIDLASAINAGQVTFDSIDHCYLLEGGTSTRVVTAQFNDLRRAGLARQVRSIQTELTDAGREWLAANTKH